MPCSTSRRFQTCGRVTRESCCSIPNPHTTTPANMFGSIRKESKIAGSLQSDAEQSLMFSTDAGSIPGLHLAAIGDEAAQHIRLFVIYLPRPVNTEWTGLASGNKSFSILAPCIACSLSSHFCSILQRLFRIQPPAGFKPAGGLRSFFGDYIDIVILPCHCEERSEPKPRAERRGRSNL